MKRKGLLWGVAESGMATIVREPLRAVTQPFALGGLCRDQSCGQAPQATSERSRSTQVPIIHRKETRAASAAKSFSQPFC